MKCEDGCPEFKPGTITAKCCTCSEMDYRISLEFKIADRVVEELMKHA